MDDEKEEEEDNRHEEKPQRRAIRQRRFKQGELALAKHPESRKWVVVKVLEAHPSGRCVRLVARGEGRGQVRGGGMGPPPLLSAALDRRQDTLEPPDCFATPQTTTAVEVTAEGRGRPNRTHLRTPHLSDTLSSPAWPYTKTLSKTPAAIPCCHRRLKTPSQRTRNENKINFLKVRLGVPRRPGDPGRRRGAVPEHPTPGSRALYHGQPHRRQRRG